MDERKEQQFLIWPEGKKSRPCRVVVDAMRKMNLQLGGWWWSRPCCAMSAERRKKRLLGSPCCGC